MHMLLLLLSLQVQAQCQVTKLAPAVLLRQH
jgi:hypothetical protein